MKNCLKAFAAVVACALTLLTGGIVMSLLTAVTGFKLHHLGALMGTVAAVGYATFLLWSVRKVWFLVNGKTPAPVVVPIKVKEPANLKAQNLIEDDEEMLEITDANGTVVRLSKTTVSLGPAKMADVLTNDARVRIQAKKSGPFLAKVNERGSLIGRVESLIVDGKNTEVSDADCRELMEIWALGFNEMGPTTGSLEFAAQHGRLGLLVKACGVDLDGFAETLKTPPEIQPNKIKTSPESVSAKGGMFPAILAGSAVWCVVLALADFNDQWIYDLSKWALCAGCLYQGYRFWQNGMKRGLMPLGILSVIFNPIAPIRFQEDEWRVVNWIAAGVFLAYIPNAVRSALKWPGNLWRGFSRMADEDPVSGLCLGAFAAFLLIAGAIIGISRLSEMTPAGKIRVAERRAKWSARIDEQKNEEVKPNLTGFDSTPASGVYRDILDRDNRPLKDDFSEIYRPSPVTPDWYPGKDLGGE